MSSIQHPPGAGPPDTAGTTAAPAPARINWTFDAAPLAFPPSRSPTISAARRATRRETVTGGGREEEVDGIRRFHGAEPTQLSVPDLVGRPRPQPLLYIPEASGARKVKSSINHGGGGSVHPCEGNSNPPCITWLSNSPHLPARIYGTSRATPEWRPFTPSQMRLSSEGS